MTYYLQVERKLKDIDTLAGFSDDVIASGAPVIFDDGILALSDPQDFQYKEALGEIMLKNHGTYFLNWFVAGQTGLSKNGECFQIQYQDHLGNWNSYVGASSHLKPAAASGFALLQTDEILEKIKAPLRLQQLDALDHEPTPAELAAIEESLNALFHTNGAFNGLWIRLINSSNASIKLSRFNNPIAGLAIFGTALVPELDGIHVQVATVTIPDWGTQIEDGELVPFNRTLTLTGDQSIYGTMVLNPETGQILMKVPGYYFVTFEIPINATSLTDDARLGLYVGDALHSAAYMPLPIGVISGSALIQVVDEFTYVCLKNLTGCTIRITAHANLTISQFHPHNA